MNYSLIIFTALLVTTMYSCHNLSDDIDNCPEIESETMNWCPSQKGDSVSILVGSDSIRFAVVSNYYEYDPEQAVGMGFGTICVSDWECFLSSDEMNLSLSLTASNDFKSATVNAFGENLHFKNFKTTSSGRYAIFEADSLDNSFKVVGVTLEYDRGFTKVELRK